MSESDWRRVLAWVGGVALVVAGVGVGFLAREVHELRKEIDYLATRVPQTFGDPIDEDRAREIAVEVSQREARAVFNRGGW